MNQQPRPKWRGIKPLARIKKLLAIPQVIQELPLKTRNYRHNSNTQYWQIHCFTVKYRELVAKPG